MRLSPKGLYRWYCRHCKTPVANTVGPRLPFVGLIHSFIDVDRAGQSLGALLGAPKGWIHTRSAVGGGPPHATQTSVAPIVARTLRKVLVWWLTGSGLPSPFFDAKLRTPRVTPRVLGSEERKAL